LLHALGHSDEAFEVLHRARAKFWSDPVFLAQYTSQGHAAAREDDAGEAIRRMVELDCENKGDRSRFKAFTIEEVKALMRERFENRKVIDQQILEGRFPWLVAGDFANRVASRDWSYRTQPLNVGDHPMARAEFAIYATNGFRVEELAPGRKALVPISCPPAGTAVVADLSSLLTLDRLGILDAACSYFGKVLVPASYPAHLLEELGRLRPIQPARLSGQRAIRDAVKQGRLGVGNEEEPSGTTPTLYEYKGEDEITRFGIVDVGAWLLDSGLIETDAFEALRREARRPASSTPDDIRSAVEAKGLLSDEFTLAKLNEHGALEPLLDSAQVFIEKESLERVTGDLSTAEFDGEILDWHSAFREKLSSDPRIELVPVPEAGPAGGDASGDQGEEEERGQRRFLPLDAHHVAEARRLPLLIDDRVFQSVLFNGPAGVAQPAFSTADLLPALAEGEHLDLDAAAGCSLRLMNWRYRFVVPPAEFLVALARRHRSHPPGERLREVARYVHDCMRDPGLHGGTEATDPPMSLAMCLSTHWATTIGQFLFMIWHDESFGDEAAVALTRWAIGECLPSVPRNSSPTFVGILGERLPQLVISGSLLYLASLKNPTRTCEALGEIARAFSLSDEAYTEVLADLLLPLVTSPSKDGLTAEILRAFAAAATHHLTELSPRAFYALCRLGLIQHAPQQVDLSEGQLAEIADRRGQAALGVPDGPLAFVLESGTSGVRVVIPVPLLVLDDDLGVRSAAVSFLRSLSAESPSSVSALGRAVLLEYSEAVLSAKYDRWFPAAFRLAQVLREDFQLNLAGLRQKISTGKPDPEKDYWPRLLRPGKALAMSVEEAQCDPVARPEEAAEDMERIARDSATLREAMESYTGRYGHLPLAPPLSLGSLVSLWCGGHGSGAEVWEQAWQWAGTRFDPLRRYHVCCLFLENPGLVPEGMQGRFWEELAKVLDASRFEETAGLAPWALRTDIARLYLLQLEAHVPGLGQDRTARLAWWASRRFVDAIERPAPGIVATEDFRNWVHEKLVLPACDRERILGIVTQRGPDSSPLWYATLYGGCPWSLSLLSALGNDPNALGPSSAPADARARISSSLKQHLLLGFPLASGSPDLSPYALSPLDEAARFWLNVEVEQESRDEFALLIDAQERLSRPGELADVLKSLADHVEPIQRLACYALAGLAHCGGVPADDIWRLASDWPWFRSAMRDLPDFAVALLLESFVSIERRYRGDWESALPYFIAGAVEIDGISAARREFLVQNVIVACAAVGSAGALRQLSLGTRPARHVAVLRSFRQRLESFAAVGAPWVKSRLRDLLSSLPPG
jgi:hypothetical protein